MINLSRQKIILTATLAVLLLSSTSAFAFRCGRKLVTENMHEIEVRNVCGAPTTSRNLGYTLRSISYLHGNRINGGLSGVRYPGHGVLSEQVVLTEYVYNFGPRKLMRRLLFEGGVLVQIETLGYGYTEKKSK